MYGQHAGLRRTLEERQMPYVMAVLVNNRVIAAVDGRVAELRADDLGKTLTPQAFKKISRLVPPAAASATPGTLLLVRSLRFGRSTH